MAFLKLKGGDDLRAAMTLGALTNFGIGKWKFDLKEEDKGYKDPLARDKAERELVAELEKTIQDEYPSLLEEGRTAHLNTFIPKAEWQDMPLDERAEVAEETARNYIEQQKKAFNRRFPKTYKDAARELRTAALKKNID